MRKKKRTRPSPGPNQLTLLVTLPAALVADIDRARLDAQRESGAKRRPTRDAIIEEVLATWFAAPAGQEVVCALV